MHQFYTKEAGKNSIDLDPEESRHLIKVLRLKEGAKVQVIDGKGYTYDCSVAKLGSKKAVLDIISKQFKQELFGIHLAVAPTKNINRWEWFLEKATEIGIDKISPIISKQSERKVLKEERNERILISAIKQSQKATKPEIEAICKFSEFIKQEYKGEKFIAHCSDHFKRADLKKLHQTGQNAVILIGPEGDFSKEEIEAAEDNGFRSINLSSSRLRTETAAIVACHTLTLCNA